MTFQWLVGASSVCLSIGCALILWGLKVVLASNPFTSLVRDAPENAERRLGPVEREHPWAVTFGTVLVLIGLAFLVVAGVARR